MDRELDKGILLAVLFLMGLGLVQVYSSSYIYAIEAHGDGLFYFRKQLLFSFLNMVTMLGIAFLPWRLAWRGAVALWLLAVIGVGLTFVPALAIKAGGAHRWLRMPFGQRFEPAELLRVTYPFLMALLLTYRRRWGVFDLPLRILFAGAPLLMVLQQPDFGTFVICCMVILTLVFVNGLKWRWVVAGSTALITAAYYLVINVPYRQARLKAFLDPWSEATDKGFQVIQSMLSFHSGGIWGVGLGQGQGKLFFLPEAHTDFTLAVLAEEMGFVGYSVVILIFGYLVFRATQVAMRVRGEFERLAAVGLMSVIGLSVFVNVGVATGMLPTKGLTLPFLSYGGSSLLSMGVAFGLLLNIARWSSGSET